MSNRLLEFFETQVEGMRLAIARGSATNDHAVDAFVMRGQGSATSR